MPPADLASLHARMTQAQRQLVMQAAEAGVVPAAGALRMIASLERALDAVSVATGATTDDAASRPVERVVETPPAPATPPVPAPPTDDLAGTVKWFSAIKGYGFIASDHGGPDVFVHISALERAGLRDLHEGERVAFRLGRDARTGKSAADALKRID